MAPYDFNMINWLMSCGAESVNHWALLERHVSKFSQTFVDKPSHEQWKYFLRSIWYPRESGWGGQARANKTMYRFVLRTWDWNDGVHKICSNETNLLQSSSWKQDSCWVAFDVTHSLMNQVISAGDWHVTYFSGKLFLKSNAWNCIVIFIR